MSEVVVLETAVKSKQWYIIHTYSGFESRVKESLRQRADAMGMGESIGEIQAGSGGKPLMMAR